MITHLVSKSLLLEVDSSGERSPLGCGGEDRSPGRKSSLHLVCR